MKKILFGRRLFYIILFFVCICLPACIFLYEKGKIDSDTKQNNEFVANEVFERDTADQEEAEMESEEMELTQEEIAEEIISETVCNRLQSVDFTIKEYPIDTEVYTEEMDKEYKEVFLGVLFNQIPIRYEDGEESYFEEISSYLKENSDENYIKILKKAFEYYYFDFDGDGLPELTIEPRIRDVHFGGPRIWKYDIDSKGVYNFGEDRWTGWKPLGSGKLYYEDWSSAGAIKYGYQEIDSQGNVVEEVQFQLTVPSSYDPSERYIIGSVGEFTHVDVEIDKESGDEMLHDFFEAIDNAVTGITFDELFSDIEHP